LKIIGGVIALISYRLTWDGCSSLPPFGGVLSFRSEARQPDSLGFRFALILALAVIVVALTTWLGPKTASEWAKPIPPSDSVYRAQHLNLY